jgi:hypothetical protein
MISGLEYCYKGAKFDKTSHDISLENLYGMDSEVELGQSQIEKGLLQILAIAFHDACKV